MSVRTYIAALTLLGGTIFGGTAFGRSAPATSTGVSAFGSTGLVGSATERFDDETLPERIRSAAEALLLARFPDHASRLRVRVLRISGSMADGPELRLRFTASDSVPKGHTQARVLVETSGGAVDAGWAVLYVSHFDSLAVALGDVGTGEIVTNDVLGTAWLDVTTFRGHPLDASTVALIRRGEHFLTTQPIAAGDALRRGDLRPPYAADTGENVQLTYHRGPVVLTLPCRARQPGVVGDVIRVYSDATQTTYKARLTAAGTADWVATL